MGKPGAHTGHILSCDMVSLSEMQLWHSLRPATPHSPPPAQQQVGSILCALPSFWTTIENHKSVSSRPDFIHHQPTTHSINHQSVSQSVSHSISQSVSQPASQSVSQSVSQTSESQPAARQAGRQAGSSQSVSQSVSQSGVYATYKKELRYPVYKQ